MSSVGMAICLDSELEADLIRQISQRSLPLHVVRRCRDLTEVLAVTQAKLTSFVVIDSEIIGIDAVGVEALSGSGAAVIVLSPLDDAERLRGRGGLVVISKDDPRVVSDRESEVERIIGRAMQLILPPPPPETTAEVTSGLCQNSQMGKIIGLWGPVGSPGRSTLTLNLAALLRSYGPVLLVDADTVEPSLVQLLAVALDSSGLISACRLVEKDDLNLESFSEVVTRVGVGVDLLTGLTKAERWREVGQKSLTEILLWARKHYRWIVVDLAAGADDPSEISVSIGPSRFSSQAAVFRVADLLLEVGLADPVGLRRLVVNHSWAQENQLWNCPSIAVVNRCRVSVGGSRWKKSIRNVIGLSAPNWPVVTIRQANDDFDKALIAGCDIATVNPRAAVLEDFVALEAEVLSNLGMVPSRKAARKRGFKKES